MAKMTYHVVPSGDHWALKKEGKDRAESTHPTQKEAIEAARDAAKEQDNIVIHRGDGTIREQITYHGPNDSNGTDYRSDSDALGVEDVMSVGTRVSWSAVLAGSVVALATYFALNVFTTALGITALGDFNSENVAIGAMILGLIWLLVSLFLGGFVASVTTVGENHSEALTYGILVWGTTMLALLIMGLSFTAGAFAGVTSLLNVAANTVPQETKREAKQEVKQEANVDDLDDVGDKVDEAADKIDENLPRDPNPAIAWWTLAGVIVSMIAAISGALVGAGPELVLRQIQGRQVIVPAKNYH